MEGGEEVLDERITFAEASKKIGKSQGYFTNMNRVHPEYFKNAHVKRVGNYLTMLDSDIDEIMEHVKKEGVRVVKALTKWTTATKRPLAAYPFYIIATFVGGPGD